MGGIRNPAANTPKVFSRAARGSSDGKNCELMTEAKKPKRQKSYHSRALPLAPAIIVRPGPARLCSVPIAGLSCYLTDRSQVNAFLDVRSDSTEKPYRFSAILGDVARQGALRQRSAPDGPA